MAKLLKQEEIYCRLLDSAGNALTSTDGALDSNTAVSFPSSMAVTHSVLDAMVVTDDKLKVLSDLYLGGTIVSDANRVPVSDGGMSLTIDNTVLDSMSVMGGKLQIGHGSLDALVVAGDHLLTRSEANLYLDGDPVANSNPVPISDAGGSLTIDHTVLDQMSVLAGKLQIGHGSLDGMVISNNRLLVQADLFVDGDPVSNSNKVQVSDGGASLTVDNSVLDSMVVSSNRLIVQADLFIDGAEVSSGNKIPIDVVTTPTIGGHGNLFNGLITSPANSSSGIECACCSVISVFGTVVGGGGSTLTIQYSQNDNDYYDSGLSASVSGGDFCMSSNAVGARFVRLKHAGASGLTLTATLAGKA